MKIRQLLVASVGLALATVSCAETLFDIQALDTLGDIKKKFPNATITVVKAAWVRENQGFYSLEGPGQPGKLMLAFNDDRPSWRESHERAWNEMSKASEPTDGQKYWENFTATKAHADDESALTISWVRWIPPSPIPLERYRSKYGAPDKCGFSDVDLTPYCTWTQRGLFATLSDDKKSVMFADGLYTRDELLAANLRRYGAILDWLNSIERKTT
jgi:hypothetical protein